MQHWLVKSEPDDWSWEDHWNAPERIEPWGGVRNHQAANFLRQMKKGDVVIFYHSVTSREMVGLLKVVKEHYPDAKDDSGKWVQVDMQAIAPLPQTVSLAQIKAHPDLQQMYLVRNSRLSVMPIRPEEWAIVREMAGLEEE